MATLFDVGRAVTDLGLLIAFILLAYMSISSHNPDIPRWKSLKFGLSLVTIIWLIPEAASNWIPTILPYLKYEDSIGYGEGSETPSLGRAIHLVSMAIFTGYVFFKARVFFRRR